MRRSRAARVLGLLCVATAAAVTPLPATGQAAVVYKAQASATAVTAQFSNPDQVPLGATIEASGQTAQAVIDQLGTSTAFASFPYPGDFVVGLPGLIAGVGGPSLPGYPLYVSSDVQTRPSAEGEGPGYALKAGSAEGRSSATARGSAGDGDAFRSGRGTAAASTTVDAAGVITARATTEVQGVSVAGLLRIGRVSSSVVVGRSPTGAITRTSSMEVEGASVAGQRVAVVDGELVLAGTTVPIAETPLGDALDDAGIEVDLTRPKDDPSGRTGGALVITASRVNDQTGTTTGTYRLGGTTAFVTFAGSRDSASPSLAAPVAPAAPAAPAADGAPGPAPAVQIEGEAPLPADEPVPAPALAEGDLPASDDVPALAPGTAGPAADGAGVRPVAAGLPLRREGAYLYLCFVVAAGALLLSLQSIRQHGVKARL